MAITTTRELVNSPCLQGVDEEIAYVITTPSGTGPSSVTVAVKDVSNDNAVVTSTVMPSGSATVSTDTITLPVLKLLTAGHRYRVEVKFTSGASIYEPWFIVRAEE